jgi:hypothetical protein
LSNMNLTDLELGLRRLLEVKSGEAQPTFLERIQLKPPQEWDDEEWEFANQRGMVPANLQVEYQRRQIERRHQEELAALQGDDVGTNFGGNVPGFGTATVPQTDPMGRPLGVQTVGGAPVDPKERLRQLEVAEERLRLERESLQEQVDAEDESREEDRESYYRSQTVPRLQGLISQRNADRSEEDQIEPDSQRKDDLVAALVEDDASQDVGAGQDEQ